MTVVNDRVRVAVIRSAPVCFNLAASLEKAVRLIKAAGKQGALLAVFGESWLPGYPVHAFSSRQSELWWKAAVRYLDQAVDFAGTAVDDLCSAASEAGIDVAIGVAERDENTRGSVYSTLALIGHEGRVINRHRKLRPSPCERLVWADGDATGLQVHDRGYANLSGLLSGEHQMALPGYALAEQGVQIHAACWPGQRSLHDVPVSMWPNQQLHSRAFAAQAAGYVLCAGYPLTRETVPGEFHDLLDGELSDGCAVIDPRGEAVAPAFEDEELIVADCSLDVVRAAKVAFDCAGHSSRQDQLKLLNLTHSMHDDAPPHDMPDDLGDSDSSGDDPSTP